MEPVNDVWVMSHASQGRAGNVPASSPLERGENNKIPAFPPKMGVPGISQRSGTPQHLRGMEMPGFGSRRWGFSSAREILFFSGRKEHDSDGEKMSGKGWKCQGIWTHPRIFSHLERGKARRAKGREMRRQGSKGRNRGISEANGPRGEGTKSSKAEEQPKPEERWVGARETQDGAGKTK